MLETEHVSDRITVTPVSTPWRGQDLRRRLFPGPPSTGHSGPLPLDQLTVSLLLLMFSVWNTLPSPARGTSTQSRVGTQDILN